MGQVQSYLHNSFSPTLAQQILKKINMLMNRCLSGQHMQELMEFRASFAAELGQATEFQKELKNFHGNPDVFISARFASKLKMLDDILLRGTSLLDMLRTNRDSFSPDLERQEIENLNSLLYDYIPQVLAKTKMSYMTILRVYDPNDTTWEKELQAILKTENCYPLLRQQTRVYEETDNKQVNALFEYIDHALLNYDHKKEAPRATLFHQYERWILGAAVTATIAAGVYALKSKH